MALRNLVEAECGAANPLVQWTSHFTQEKSMLKGSLDHDRISDITQHHGRGKLTTEQQMVNEFLHEQRPAVPQTYHMGSLLHEVQSIHQPRPQAHTKIHTDVYVQKWVDEYAPVHAGSCPTQALRRDTSDTWVREFEQLPPAEAQHWVSEFAPTEEEKWVSEFEQRMKSSRDVSSVAKEMTDTVTDPGIQATEFMDFVKKLSTGEVTMEDNQEVVTSGRSQDWADEFEKVKKSEAGGFWAQLENEWNDLAKQEAGSHPWLSEFNSHEDKVQEYAFQQDNPLKDVTNPLEEGMKKLEAGHLPSAVLLFEAEVQARPDSVKGWQYLGSTQADNEQDVHAIAALHKCLELDPGNLEAHLSLAVSYTNESQQTKALAALRGWIQHNPKYSQLVHGEPLSSHKPFTGSLMTREEHTAVRDLYLSAAQLAPDELDHHVQVGLGVLFNLSREYEKAADCFSAGLNIRPNDAMLWNKLGATLANNNGSGEAVSAYRKALEIMPGFTRCRYNLGVSCINLGAYKEAVEHFLTALNIQRQARGPQGSKVQMSDSIWGTLRIAITFLGRQDMQSLLEGRDLDGLLSKFGLAL